MTILELREKRNKAWEAAKAFVAAKAGLILLGDSAESFNGTLAQMQNRDTSYKRLWTVFFTLKEF